MWYVCVNGLKVSYAMSYMALWVGIGSECFTCIVPETSNEGKVGEGVSNRAPHFACTE